MRKFNDFINENKINEGIDNKMRLLPNEVKDFEKRYKKLIKDLNNLSEFFEVKPEKIIWKDVKMARISGEEEIIKKQGDVSFVFWFKLELDNYVNINEVEGCILLTRKFFKTFKTLFNKHFPQSKFPDIKWDYYIGQYQISFDIFNV